MIELIALTGGIGAGKSVVSRILRTMGYAVYDTDSEAKRIMDSSSRLKCALVNHFGEDVVVGGQINRKRLGEIVFNDKSKLLKLNGLVHGAVIADLRVWREAASQGKWGNAGQRPFLFVETAILYESGLDAYVDRVWEVVAPVELRIERIVKRSGGLLTTDDAKARIIAQTPDSTRTLRAHTYIINDDVVPVLPQVCSLLANHP